MKLALMRCCATGPLLDAYEAATDAVLSRLGVGIVDLDFNCCGYPLRNSHFDAYVLSSARNLALAESARLDLLTVCSCCYGSLRHVDHLLRTDAALRCTANAAVEKERLHWSGSAQVRHLLQVLQDDVGLDAIRAGRKVRLDGLKVACHYGCHLLRPGHVAPGPASAPAVILDQVVEATGAASVEWGAKLDCCGSPASGVDDELSRRLAEKKLESARESGADVICVVCPYCHLQLERVQRRPSGERNGSMPVILVHQLVGLSLGIPPADLGLAGWQLPAVSSRGRDGGGASDG